MKIRYKKRVAFMHYLLKAALISVCFFVVLFSTQGCSDSGSGSTPSPDNTTPDQLATSLVRQSGDSYTVVDLWRCIDIDLIVKYFALINSDEGEAIAFFFPESATNTELNTQFRWEIDGKDSLKLYEQNGQLHESFSYIVFSTERSLSLNSSANGYLSCTYLTGDEITRVSASELIPGEVVASEQMLPVASPEGFDGMLTYFAPPFNPVVDIRWIRDVKALFNGNEIAASIRRTFMYGPEQYNRSSYYLYEGGDLYLSSMPVDTSSESARNQSYQAVAQLVEAGGVDERIEGCYSDVKRFDEEYFGTAFLITISNRWCFKADGSFLVANGDTIEELDADSLQPNQYSRGRYRIDGHAIRLLFDSGFQTKGGFGWIDRAEKRVYLLSGYPILD